MDNWSKSLRCTVDPKFTAKLPKRYLIEASDAVASWQHNLPQEETGVFRMFGVPSLVVALDCAPGNCLNVIDIEGGAAGLGFAKEINIKTEERLKKIQCDWPKVRFLVSQSLFTKHDHHLWLDCAYQMGASRQADLLFVIANQGEMADYSGLSATPLATRGDKSYGDGWLWHDVGPADFDSLFAEYPEGFCLRRHVGVNMKGLYIFHPKHSIKGSSTRTQMLRVLEENGTMYCQSFKQSVFSIRPDPTVHRVFFLYDVKSREYVYAGGLLISRKNLKAGSVYNSTLGIVS
jgi:hypothetical protein